MAYTVKYKYRDEIFWKKIRHVIEDGFVQETTQFPIRYFVIERGARIEIPCEDTIFRICGAGSAPVKVARPVSAPAAQAKPAASAPSESATATSGLSDADRGTAYAKLAEVLFWLGEYSKADADKEKYFGEGVEYGKRAVELLPESVEANMWYAANMGSHGLVRGIMSSLFYLGPMEKHGNKSIELDETYFQAAPLRLMGRFYHQAPGWPIGSGDTNKAIQILERAVQLGPDFLYNHVYLADAYLSKRRKDEARALLEDVLSRPVSEKYPMHHEMVVAEAKAIMAKL